VKNSAAIIKKKNWDTGILRGGNYWKSSFLKRRHQESLREYLKSFLQVGNNLTDYGLGRQQESEVLTGVVGLVPVLLLGLCQGYFTRSKFETGSGKKKTPSKCIISFPTKNLAFGTGQNIPDGPKILTIR
jgi:hypothetical protein